MALSFLSDPGFMINAILLLLFIVVLAIAVNGPARKASDKQLEKPRAVRQQIPLKAAPQAFACPSATKYEKQRSIQPTAQVS